MRRMVAEIFLDEEQMLKVLEERGKSDDGDISFVVSEINSLCENDGISVGDCRILDDDDAGDEKAIDMVNSVLEFTENY